jgi:hypothetical protein
LSISGALRSLAPQAFERIPVPGAPPRPTPEQEAIDRAKAAKEQRLTRKVEFAIRTGQEDPPADLTTWEADNWRGKVYEAKHAREENIPTILDTFAYQLSVVAEHGDPREAALWLTNNRRDILGDLQRGVGWLQLVLEEAEADLRQRQRYEEAPKLGEQVRMQNPE